MTAPEGRPDETAEALLRTFWANLSVGVGTEGGWTAPKGSIAALDPLISQVEPLRGGRSDQSSGRPLDFLAPSAWHACAFLTFMDFLGRASKQEFSLSEESLFSGFYRQRPLYRGQAHPWPMLPTAWRTNDESLAAWRRSVFHQLLSRHAKPERDPLLALLGHVQRKDQSDAVAQHYGLPTNLLDFTFNPLIACTFACAPCDGAYSPRPRSCAPEGCAVVYWVPIGNDLVWPAVRAELPPVTVDRLYRQSGLFLEFGDRHAYQETQLRPEIGAHQAAHQMRRIFFPRSYPVAREYVGFASLVGQLETPSTFVEELVNVVRDLEPVSANEAACDAADRAERQVSRRSEWQHLVRIITDDEMLTVFHRLEYYVRMAALMQMNGDTRINPFVLAALSGTITPSILGFRGALDHLLRSPQTGDRGNVSTLESIRWFTDRVIEARVHFESGGPTDRAKEAGVRFDAFRAKLDELP